MWLHQRNTDARSVRQYSSRATATGLLAMSESQPYLTGFPLCMDFLNNPREANRDLTLVELRLYSQTPGTARLNFWNSLELGQGGPVTPSPSTALWCTFILYRIKVKNWFI